MIVPVIIPAYEPDERMLETLNSLFDNGISPIIIVNDGSDPRYDSLFESAERIINKNEGVVLMHDINRGKGRALKTAFSYVLKNYHDAIGCVTVDSDGQHTSASVKKVINELSSNPDCLILGYRDFNSFDVPWKSKLGNKLTIKIMGFLSGIKLRDTQTGLRGIPSSFMDLLLDVPGERFEFETQMLMETFNKYKIIEIPIETIYESKNNHQTHFNLVKDSVEIYKVLWKRFIVYFFSSVSSSVIDLCIFVVLCNLLRKTSAFEYAAVATVFARISLATIL